MTTKFLDNKIFTFKILLSWRFPWEKNSVFGRFSSLPPCPPFKSANFIFIVVSPSLRQLTEINRQLTDNQDNQWTENSLYLKISLVARSAWTPQDGPPNPCVFPCEEFLVLFSVFPFFSRDSGGSVGFQMLVLWGWFSLPFSQRKDRVTCRPEKSRFLQGNFAQFSLSSCNWA